MRDPVREIGDQNSTMRRLFDRGAVMFAEEPAAPGFGEHGEATESGSGGGLRADPEKAEGNEAYDD